MLVGQSQSMVALWASIKKLASSAVNVLVTGESGTGKELVARALHEYSARRDKPFVAVNCGAISDELMSSELFGHVKGAYTGAMDARPGVFVEAHQGTLFLDEVSEIPLSAQPRLLRVLQEREVRPVGGTGARPVDVRVVSASNRDLEPMVERGEFRADLYYRLNVFKLALPPLRERLDDVPMLVQHFVRKYGGGGGVSAPAMAALCKHGWPGNVRELENVIQYALALVGSAEIDIGALPPRIRGLVDEELPEIVAGLSWDKGFVPSASYSDARRRAQNAFERSYLTHLMKTCGGNVSQAARRAKLDRSNLRKLLVRHQIEASLYRYVGQPLDGADTRGMSPVFDFEASTPDRE